MLVVGFSANCRTFGDVNHRLLTAVALVCVAAIAFNQQCDQSYPDRRDDHCMVLARCAAYAHRQYSIKCCVAVIVPLLLHATIASYTLYISHQMAFIYNYCRIFFFLSTSSFSLHSLVRISFRFRSCMRIYVMDQSSSPPPIRICAVWKCAIKTKCEAGRWGRSRSPLNTHFSIVWKNEYSRGTK